MLRTIALAAVLLAQPVAAQETTSESRPSQPESSGAAADEGQQAPSDTEGLKGYGYGTPPGVETHGAQQATEPGREPPKAPQQEEGASVTQPHARAETGTLSGRVVRTDQDRLTVEGPDGLRDFRLTSGTRVRGEGRERTSQLRPGDEVRVSFEPAKEGVSVAKQIEVQGVGARSKADVAPAPGSATPPGSTTPPPGSATPPGSTTPAPGGTRR